MKHLTSKIIVCAATLGATILTGIVFGPYFAFPSTNRIRHFTALYADKYIQDGNELAKHPFFQYPSRKTDANRLMGSKIFWNDPSRPHPTPISRELDERVRKLSETDGVKHFLSEVGKSNFQAETARYDLSWMAKLREYDHWDLENSPEEKRECGKHSSQILCETHGLQPRLGYLQSVVFLRLAKGIEAESKHPGSLREALE